MKLTHFITSLELGGAQSVLYDLVTHLDTHQFEHEIIFIHDGPYRKPFEDAGIPVHPLTGFISPYDPIGFYRLIKLLKKFRPDCLHTILWSANWLGRIAARFLRIKCINSLHNNVDQNGYIRTFLDMLAPAPNQLIAVSNEVRISYRTTQRTSCPILVIPNGVDTRQIQNRGSAFPRSRTDLGFSEKNFLIGSVGRFHPIKRFSFLLETFQLLHVENPAVRLLLVGSGPQEQELRQHAAKLGIAHVVYFATNQRATPYYPLMDLFVLSSEKEGISIALLEAMSHAVPPVVTYHTDVHPVIKTGSNGYVAKTSKATVFSRTISQLIGNESLRRTMGGQAQHTVTSQFSITAMIAAYEKIFVAQYSP